MASSSFRFDVQSIKQFRRTVDFTKPGFQHRGHREHRESNGIRSLVWETVIFFYSFYSVPVVTSVVKIFWTYSSVANGNNAMLRARLIASPSHRWWREHVPVMRRGRILPRSCTNGWSISTFL